MKKIVIIGASSGLGLRMATDFARVGCRVGLAARRTDTLEEIKALYPDRVAVSCIDVRATDSVKKFYDLIELIDGMDILIYASGVGFQDPELNDSKIRDIVDTNCTGFARILAAAYRYYRETANVRPGQIAAITSIAGTKGIGLAAAYSASKRFQRNFIDALEQLAYTQQVNVKFTDIRPGFVRTPFLNPAIEYPMILSVNKAAPLIETAILRKRRVAYIDSRWGVVNGLWSLVPQAVWKHVSLDI
ncbi:MAG: SDR family NAD(P)-dependent oxidoreductase [Paramuribaculum sp.]|nr:SDR family NAD(P)-dependent oxidoreductase [Paramuribaculum sp.]